MPKVTEIIPEALRTPEIELTPRRRLAKRAWEMSDRAVDAPGILLDLLAESQAGWIEDHPEWPNRVMRARSWLQKREEYRGRVKKALSQGILPPRLIIVGGLDSLAERQRGIPQAGLFHSVRVASEIKGEAIVFATRAKSIYVRGLPFADTGSLRWTLPHASGTCASSGTEASPTHATGHERACGLASETTTPGLGIYIGESSRLAPPVTRDEGDYSPPIALPTFWAPTEFSVDHETAREWQVVESMELSRYSVPYGFHCDPNNSPEEGNWLETCPRSFRWLDHKHGITAKSVTGLELGLYQDLDTCEANGLARLRCAFWPLLDPWIVAFCYHRRR